MIGVGWTGSILARELTKAGLNVVGLERGANRTPREDFTLPNVRDDLKYAVRQELFQDAALETGSLRHSPAQTALPNIPRRSDGNSRPYGSYRWGRISVSQRVRIRWPRRSRSRRRSAWL